jgi:hypothetical protein
MTEPWFPTHPDLPGPFQAAEALTSGLATTVRLARVMAASGRPIDVSGLDAQMGLLCAKALDLPTEQGAQLRPALISLLADMDALLAVLAHPTDPADRG